MRHNRFPIMERRDSGGAEKPSEVPGACSRERRARQDSRRGLFALRSVAAAKTGKEVTAVTAKREHLLVLPLSAYQKWADRLVEGFKEADRFLKMEGLHNPKFLPYRTQLVPLAAVMVHLRDRWR